MHSSRSPPPLQHPRPQHPPSQIPSTSPPPDAPNNSNSGGYERFSSPGAQGHQQQQQQQLHHSYVDQQYGQQQHHQQQYQQQLPESYIPAGHQGQLGHAYAAPPFPSSSSSTNAPWQSHLGGSVGGGGAEQWPGMNDATAQMGVQFGKHAFDAGTAYLDKNFTRLLPLAHLKHSFNVSNSYVLLKLRIVLWPWRHRPWSRALRRSETSGVAEGWKPPREDINCPDLYIPVMALVTYILLSAVIAGSQGQFDPRILGQTASKAIGLLFLEFLCIKLGTYLLGIGEEGAVVDLLAYEGYKFVGIIVALLCGLLGAKGWVYIVVCLYVFLANFFFLLRSLRHIVLPDPTMSPLDTQHNPAATSSGISAVQRKRRIEFLFVIAAAQGISMGILVRV